VDLARQLGILFQVDVRAGFQVKGHLKLMHSISGGRYRRLLAFELVGGQPSAMAWSDHIDSDAVADRGQPFNAASQVAENDILVLSIVQPKLQSNGRSSWFGTEKQRPATRGRPLFGHRQRCVGWFLHPHNFLLDYCEQGI
jgi:hypothetical protein